MVQEKAESGAEKEGKEPVVEHAAESGSAEMTEQQRDEAAAKLVDRFALWSGAAGFIPVPLLDVAAVGGVQLQMLRRLAEIYAVPFSEVRGKSVIASTIGALVPASAATGASVMKLVPGVGTVIAAVAMPAFSAGATYLIGRIFIQHFASGGTLLDFDPAEYREFIKSHGGKPPGESPAESPPAKPSTGRAPGKGAAASSA